MAISNNDEVLNKLVHRFIRELNNERKARLTQIDVAAEIARHFGSDGLLYLSGVAGLDLRTVTEYARIGQAFPPMVRQQYPTLIYTHYRTALQLSRLYDGGEGSQPLYWVRKAFENHWSATELLRQGKAHLPVQSPVEDAVRRVVRLTMEGHKHEGLLVAQVIEHNARYAAFTGITLTLSRTSYVAP